MAYSTMMAPFDFADHNKIAARQLFDNYAFFELTPKQAGEYFKWFKSEIPYRLELLWAARNYHPFILLPQKGRLHA